MKTKKLVILLGLCTFMLAYFLFCNYLVNKEFKEKTHFATENYVQGTYPNASWEYVKALPHDKNSFFVEIEIKNNKETLKDKIKYNYNDFFDI